MTNGKIIFDVFFNPVNIVLPSTCYLKKSKKSTQRNGFEITKLVKAKATLAAIVATFVKNIWFLKAHLALQ